MAGISLPDSKTLWMRSGDKCAFQDCKRELAIEIERSGRTSILSQEAHIVAVSPNGPRGTSTLTEDERNSYSNLILLCLDHHKIIDDDPETWTVEVLHRMKSDHEAWFKSLRSPDEERLAVQELIFVEIVQEWEEKMELDSWSWVSSILHFRVPFSAETLERIDTVRLWLYSRPWPPVFPELRRAFENFEEVVNTLFMVADCALTDRHATGDLTYWPLHKQRQLTEEEYRRSLATTEWIEDLIHDLVFELTRAANWILDEVRSQIDPRHRMDTGVLLLQRPEGLGSKYYRPQYKQEETHTGKPFGELREFLEQRRTRDIFIGNGFDSEGWREVTPMTFG